jgi:hypothetical protein
MCNVNIEVEVYEEQTREFNTLTLVRCFKVSERKTNVQNFFPVDIQVGLSYNKEQI